MAPGGVDGQLAANLYTATLDEGPTLSLGAEAVVLDGEENQGTEMVIDLGDVDVLGGDACHVEESGAGCCSDGLGYGAAFDDGRDEALGNGGNVDGPVTHVLCPLGGGDNDCSPTIGFEAAVEEVEGVIDHTGVLVVFDGHGSAVHDGPGVHVGVLAAGDGDGAEVRAGGAILIHVASGVHG